MMESFSSWNWRISTISIIYWIVCTHARSLKTANNALTTDTHTYILGDHDSKEDAATAWRMGQDNCRYKTLRIGEKDAT